MEDRKAIREKAWTLSGWSDTVKQVRFFSLPSRRSRFNLSFHNEMLTLFFLLSDGILQTVKLAKGMTSQIMVPMSWSPLK